MGKLLKTSGPPLFLQSKLLCFSLSYLFAVLFLALRHSLSSTKCLFRSSPFDPILTPLFSYPPSYGEHKYALPTHRASCSNPLFFSDYAVAHNSIGDFCRNASEFWPVLRYLQGESETFGGNFSTQKRISYFDRRDNDVEVPCGFFKKFPVSDPDRTAMEKCDGVVVVSAIFNDHDKIRQPKGLGTKTLGTTCFFMFVDDNTLRGLEHHKLIPRDEHKPKIGVWRLVRISCQELYENPAMNGVIPKYLVHRLFPNSKFSIWIDAKLQLMVDPLLLIHSLVVSKDVDMAISKHPFFVHTMEEAIATARWKKWWDVGALALQMETYCENGLRPWSTTKLPYPTDVPDSGVILRKHGVWSNLFSCLVFNELEAFNPRDQLAFAFVRDEMKPKLKINMFEVQVFEQVVLEYRHNLKRFGSSCSSTTTTAAESPPDSCASTTKPTKKPTTHQLFVNDSCCSSCHQYLLEMWGERESRD